MKVKGLGAVKKQKLSPLAYIWDRIPIIKYIDRLSLSNIWDMKCGEGM
jgi:hypothetical protein